MFGFCVIFEAHGILSEENKAKNRPAVVIRVCSLIERFAVGRSDHVIALSRDIFEFYKTFNDEIDLIPAFVDEQVYKAAHTRAADFKTIGLVGPFDMPANKYYLQFLYEHVDAFDPRIRFRIIGKCDNMIADDRITYTGYLSSRDGYAAELASLDALLVPAQLPTSGPLNKILEGMACSLPVYTTPEGIVGLNCLENGKNIIVEEGRTLVGTINQSVFNDALTRTIGDNARKLVEQQYSRAANKAKLVRIMEQWLHRDTGHL
jgi:glycosyltransferase involved in cell wall biosynthesis